MNGIGNATFAVVDSTYCVQAATGPRTAFHGSAGTLILNERGAEAPIELYREDERLDIHGWLPVQVDSGWIGWSLATGVEHLAGCIRAGRRPLISAEHARHCLELMLKAMEAARTGVAQELTTMFCRDAARGPAAYAARARPRRRVTPSWRD